MGYVYWRGRCGGYVPHVGGDFSVCRALSGPCRLQTECNEPLKLDDVGGRGQLHVVRGGSDQVLCDVTDRPSSKTVKHSFSDSHVVTAGATYLPLASCYRPAAAMSTRPAKTEETLVGKVCLISRPWVQAALIIHKQEVEE
jgi:hypothetical protein